MNNGVRGRRGPLTANGISYILGNEVYVGDKLLQKRAPKDMLTKQPDKRIPFESNYVRGDHEGIISREMWNAAQHRLKRSIPGSGSGSAPAGGSSGSAGGNGSVSASSPASTGIPTWPEAGCGSAYISSSISSGGNKSPLFGKIICGECGSLMTRRTYSNKAEGNYRVWVCKEHINNGSNNTASSHNYSAGSNAGSNAASPAHSDNNHERLCHMRNLKDTDLIAEIRRQWDIRTRETAQTVAQTAQTAAQSARTVAQSGHQFAETKLEVIFYKIQRIIVSQDKIEIEWVTAR